MTDVPRSPRAPLATAVIPDRLRRPIHFGTLLGVSTGLYATTLAGVAVLQQHADDDLTAARAPAIARAQELQAANDQLAIAVNALGSEERGASGSYEALRARIGALEVALDGLAVTVTDVSGAAAALPQRIALPAVPSRSGAAAPRTKPPATHAKTGASGGG